ncbi:thiol reductant ABC exporter subunit CydC [Paenibacillus daejeonensis]|uniref:thiol reductant ABC exporter subunit CydC n=1 Tax=Paenibacillus daejeonensis TaxID=135193 RepID=UPI00037D69DF|nr:thiol reductant ABC exporter subunit CydC [Paenibacillus daejeonensis]
MSEWSVMARAMLHERKDILIAILCGFIAGIGGVGLFAASGYMISQAAFLPPLYTLIVLTSLVKILGIIRAASRYGERLFSHRATFSMLSRLRTSFFAKLAPLTPRIFNKQRSGDLLARIVGDVESLQHYFLRVAYPPVILVLVFLATIVFAAAFSIWVALLLVLAMLAAAILLPSLALLGQREVYRQVRLQRAALSTEVTELLYGYRDLKVYGQLEMREEQLQLASDELARSQQKAAGNLLVGQSAHAFLTHAVSWGVLALGAYLITQGELAGVFLAMLVLVAQTMFEEAAGVANLPSYKLDSEHAARRLAETVDEVDAGPPQPSGTLATEGPVAISLRDVTYQPDEAWRPTLRGVNLEIPAGSKTAIVGPSGAGKTTILELILKLHLPTHGEIRLNGIATTELHEESIWAHSRVVLQHNHFFRGAIRDNLQMSDASLSDEVMESVLSQVKLAAKGLNDPVFEKGENLSDGEKQRLALARAILKGGRLWLLDEPTSSLDAVTEQQVNDVVNTIGQDDTMIWIRHRLAGLETMDQIIVLEQGQVVEAGTYDELMARRGYFYEMKQIEREVVEGG